MSKNFSTPLPQRVPLNGTTFGSTSKCFSKTGTSTKLKPPGRVPLKMDSDKNKQEFVKPKVTPGPQRVRREEDLEKGGEGQCYTVPGIPRSSSRTVGFRDECAMEGDDESLRRHLDFGGEIPLRGSALNLQISPIKKVGFDTEPTFIGTEPTSIGTESTFIDTEPTSVGNVAVGPSKMARYRDVIPEVLQQLGRSTSEKKLFNSKCDTLFDDLLDLSCADSYDFTDQLQKVISLEYSRQEEAATVYRTLLEFLNRTEARIKKLRDTHTAVKNLFTATFKESLDLPAEKEPGPKDAGTGEGASEGGTKDEAGQSAGKPELEPRTPDTNPVLKTVLRQSRAKTSSEHRRKIMGGRLPTAGLEEVESEKGNPVQEDPPVVKTCEFCGKAPNELVAEASSCHS